MPQRTSKLLLGRLTANENAFLLQIRITSFAQYTVGLDWALRVVIKIQ